MNKEELKDLKNDCPTELLDLLDVTPKRWRLAVAKQFIDDHKWKIKMEAKIRILSWQNTGIIGILVFIVAFLLYRGVFYG